MDAIIFVSDGGLLEPQAAILAASLKTHVSGHHQLICAVPKQIDNTLLEFLKYLGVRVEAINNDFYPQFGLANKCLACNIPIDCTRKIFLDSDLLCTTQLNLDSLPSCEIYTQIENPFPPLTQQNWEDASRFFQINLLQGDDLTRCLNDPVLVFHNKIGFETQWLLNLKSIHKAYHKKEIRLKTRRKMSRLAFLAAIRAKNYDLVVDPPFSWDGDPQWWNKCRCECHAWEKSVPIWNRQFNQMICQPDHIYGFIDGQEYRPGLPQFLALQDGMGYCEIHQGKLPVGSPRMGLTCYPFIRSMLYEILTEFPTIDQLHNWPLYCERYFHNKATSWFQKETTDNKLHDFPML